MSDDVVRWYLIFFLIFQVANNKKLIIILLIRAKNENEKKSDRKKTKLSFGKIFLANSLFFICKILKMMKAKLQLILLKPMSERKKCKKRLRVWPKKKYALFCSTDCFLNFAVCTKNFLDTVVPVQPSGKRLKRLRVWPKKKLCVIF